MFYFGVDYYPEHWDEARWEIDAALMADAGMNVVRLAEFAWQKLEPVEGKYDFDWLDRVLTILASHGIAAVLGTPTASPPAWLMSAHPEAYRVREDGRTLTYGNRREYCPTSPIYAEYSRRIVTHMAQHYKDNPAVIGWQIDNEFGERCYCAVCAAKFQDWLQERYTTLDNLNEQWGTVFWSHIYTAWGQVPLPLSSGGSPNPGLALDFDRFASDAYVAYQKMQVDILRAACPNHFITHNFMGFYFDQLNYYDLARDLDLVAWDNYPRTQWSIEQEPDPAVYALSHDAMRGLKRQNFWMMEQQAGPGGWEIVAAQPRPGEVRLWAYQAIAHGADGMVFFRWRTCRFGTEEYWHGLLDHDAAPSRRYHEVKGMGAEIKQLGDTLKGALLKPEVAMLNAYDTRFAFQIQKTNPSFNYAAHFQDIYRGFHRQGVGVDVVGSGTDNPDIDLSAYKLVVVPALYVVSERTAIALKRYADAGGTLVLTARCGVKDISNTVVDIPLPGLLADLCGATVEEYDSLPSAARNPLKFLREDMADLPPVAAATWCDILKPYHAETAAVYTQDYYAGKPAVTVNAYGQGKVVYIGALGDAALLDALTGWLTRLAAVTPPLLCPPAGVEVTERWQGEQRLLFVLNHNANALAVTLDQSYRNLLDGKVYYKGVVSIPARGVWVLVEVV